MWIPIQFLKYYFVQMVEIYSAMTKELNANNISYLHTNNSPFKIWNELIQFLTGCCYFTDSINFKVKIVIHKHTHTACTHKHNKHTFLSYNKHTHTHTHTRKSTDFYEWILREKFLKFISTNFSKHRNKLWVGSLLSFYASFFATQIIGGA